MKNILFLLLLLLSNNLFCQEVFDEASMISEGSKIINEANARIVRSDTTIEVRTKEKHPAEQPIIDNKWKVIRHYDSENKLVMVEQKTFNAPTSTTTSLPSLFIFDKNNNAILECRNDLYGATWLLALLKYDDQGILLEKKFWNFVAIAKMVYDDPKNPKKYSLYNSHGEKVRSLRRAKRKIPY